MQGKKAIRKLTKRARAERVSFETDQRGGKGSHMILHYGRRRTTAPSPDKDWRKGLLRKILKDLDLPPDALD